MTARRRDAKRLCRLPIHYLATVAGASTVAAISVSAEGQRDIAIPLGAAALLALALGTMQITLCSANAKPLPATEQERAGTSDENRSTGPLGGRAANPTPTPKDSHHG